jgi:hypothetical protein
MAKMQTDTADLLCLEHTLNLRLLLILTCHLTVITAMSVAGAEPARNKEVLHMKCYT